MFFKNIDFSGRMWLSRTCELRAVNRRDFENEGMNIFVLDFLKNRPDIRLWMFDICYHNVKKSKIVQFVLANPSAPIFPFKERYMI